MKNEDEPKDKRLKPGDAQKLTMAEVAKYVGVSAMTVSRAFRQDASVSEETRKRIMEAVDALGYVLDLSAGSLSSRRSGFIAALVPSINNSNFSDTARGMTDALQNTGLQLLLGYTDYSTEKEEELIEAMLRRRPEGIILTGGSHTARARRMLVKAGIPVVETWEFRKIRSIRSSAFPTARRWPCWCGRLPARDIGSSAISEERRRAIRAAASGAAVSRRLSKNWASDRDG